MYEYTSAQILKFNFSAVIYEGECYIEEKSDLILLVNGNDETSSPSWHTQHATTTIDDR